MDIRNAKGPCRLSGGQGLFYEITAPRVKRWLYRFKLDNISTICRSTSENKSDLWLPVQGWALRMRSQGKSVLLVHHDGKGGMQGGSSRKEDVLDTVIQLTRPKFYTPEQGAMFEVYFRKKQRALRG